MNFRSVQVDGGITSIALRGQGHQVCNEVNYVYFYVIILFQMKKLLLATVNSSSQLLSGVVEDNPELMRDNTILFYQQENQKVKVSVFMVKQIGLQLKK